MQQFPLWDFRANYPKAEIADKSAKRLLNLSFAIGSEFSPVYERNASLYHRFHY